MSKIELIKANIITLLVVAILIALFWYILGYYTYAGVPILFLVFIFFCFALTFEQVHDLKKENEELKKRTKN